MSTAELPPPCEIDEARLRLPAPSPPYRTMARRLVLAALVLSLALAACPQRDAAEGPDVAPPGPPAAETADPALATEPPPRWTDRDLPPQEFAFDLPLLRQPYTRNAAFAATVALIMGAGVGDRGSGSP
jgi:hypothetical protein